MRYEYTIEGNKVICTTHFATKPVIGVAKCDPLDKFDETYGKKLAKARADAKVAEKRQKLARKQLKEAYEAFDRALLLIGKKDAYLEGSTYERILCDMRVDDLLDLGGYFDKNKQEEE
jgi:hypothetical protein